MISKHLQENRINELNNLKSKKNIVQSNARLLAALNQDFSAKEQAAFYKQTNNP